MGKDNCREHFGVFQTVRTQTQLRLGGIRSAGAEVWSEIVTSTSELWLLNCMVTRTIRVYRRREGGGGKECDGYQRQPHFLSYQRSL